MRQRYFFDIHNGGDDLDETGLLLEREAVPREVAKIMADIARDELPRDERHGVITVKVRDEGGNPVSVGSLTFTYKDF